MERAHGVTFKEITKSNFKTIPITLPTLPEQRIIACVLRGIQNAIEARRCEVALEQERKAALMQYFFTHGTRGETRKNTEIGKIPESWTVVKLGDFCNKKTLINPKKQPNKPFIYVDVSSVSNEFYCIIETKEIMGKDAPSRARELIKADDVIFATVRPTLKRVAMVPLKLNDQVCSTGFCVVRVNRDIFEPVYVYFYLLTEQVAKKVESLQKGATYPAINDFDIYGLLMPLPSLTEQRKIASILYACDAKLVALDREMQVLEELFKAILEELMTGRLSVIPLIEMKNEIADEHR